MSTLQSEVVIVIEVVDCHHLITTQCEEMCYFRPNKTGRAGDQYLHFAMFCSANPLFVSVLVGLIIGSGVVELTVFSINADIPTFSV